MFEALFKGLQNELTLKFGIGGTIIITLLVIVYKLFMNIISDKNEQIKRLAEENRDYREKFKSILDRYFNNSNS